MSIPFSPPTPRARLDLLRLPLLGRFFRWRYSRLMLQIPLLLVALLAIYDGLSGQQIAGRNFATVSVWLHYRGVVVIALLMVGNLFCAACPMMLTRGPSKWLKQTLMRPLLERRRRAPAGRGETRVSSLPWPPKWRSKVPTVLLFVLYLLAYEVFDLWASPWLTAWLILGYFGAALLIDTLFPAGSFCKYVCPLGQFNFALSSASPSQITAKDPSVCLSCAGKYCLNGRIEARSSSAPDTFEALAPLPLLHMDRVPHPGPRPEVSSADFNTQRALVIHPGCETQLYVPQMQSNTDCTLCLNCLRACPYDNVALELRPAARSWRAAPPRADWALYGVLLFWGGLFNALAMTDPLFALAGLLSSATGIRSEFLLLLVLLLLLVGLGSALTLGVLRASSRLLGHSDTARQALRRWGWVFFPLALSMWAGHYSYHFLTGWASIVPVAQNALERLGLYGGPVAWQYSGLIPENWLFPTQVLILYAGYGAALYVAMRIALTARRPSSVLPLFLLLSVLSVLVLVVLAQPMQARGTLLVP